ARGQHTGAPNRRFRREDGDVLPEVEAPAELVDGLLPRAHFAGGRSSAEPLGKRHLARFGSRGVQALEERRAAEEVQIARVGMAVEKARAVAPRPGPPVGEALETTH